jgi:hypothetical protein
VTDFSLVTLQGAEHQALRGSLFGLAVIFVDKPSNLLPQGLCVTGYCVGPEFHNHLPKDSSKKAIRESSSWL